MKNGDCPGLKHVTILHVLGRFRRKPFGWDIILQLNMITPFLTYNM